MEQGSEITALLPPWEGREITLDPKVLDLCVGKYQLASIGAFVVTCEGTRL